MCDGKDTGILHAILLSKGGCADLLEAYHMQMSFSLWKEIIFQMLPGFCTVSKLVKRTNPVKFLPFLYRAHTHTTQKNVMKKTLTYFMQSIYPNKAISIWWGQFDTTFFMHSGMQCQNRKYWIIFFFLFLLLRSND